MRAGPALDIDGVLREFSPIRLEELDERASLGRRVDVKYLVDRGTFATLCETLRDDHDALELGGRRSFRYESVYFDTPDLRCYRDHVADRHPRFKARTRLYSESSRCVFEVKLKVSDDETDKRQIDYPPERRETLTGAAVRFLERTLGEKAIDAPKRLDPTLRTCFRRATLASRSDPDRLTCDVELELSTRGASAWLRPSLVLLETKSKGGESRADAALAELGVDPVPLSKYRAGIELLGEAPAGAERHEVNSAFAQGG